MDKQMSGTATARHLVDEAWQALGGPPADTARVELTGPAVTLASRLPVTALAQASVAVAGLAAAGFAAARDGGSPPPVTVDSRAAAVAFTSERHLRIDGEAQRLWAPLSRFLPAADGWVRLHGNYPHHRARLFAALDVDPDGDDPPAAVARTVAERPARDVEDAVTARGGLAVAVRTADEWRRSAQGEAVARTPLVAVERVTDAPAPRRAAAPTDPLLPADGIRVLDLTRVIAGPVGTRTLAAFGADVLRVDSPRLPEIPVQHVDTGFGKRSTLLDLGVPGDRDTFETLLAEADVLVYGYRAGALDRYGLAPDAVLERHPRLVVATLNAWGPVGPWAGRRGFDSLVQAATGIAVVEAGGDPAAVAAGDREPGVLPAQALDHGTGYLLAAAVLRALTGQLAEGGGWRVELSLARTGGWLLDHACDQPDAVAFDPAPRLARVPSPFGELTYALPPARVDGAPVTWADPPVPWGSSRPRWRDHRPIG
ncbi:MAG TPA: CoA transferase [Micromonosporaceae bacterium]